MSTTLAIVDRIRILMVNRGSRETYTDADIISTAVNPIAREIATVALAVSRSTSVVTVAGQGEYSFPATVAPFLRMSSIEYGADRRKLAYRDNNEIGLLTPVSGLALYWTIWGDKLRLRPIPSTSGDTIYIDVYSGSNPCAAITPAASLDELQFMSDAEDCLVVGSAKAMCAIDREVERTQMYMSDYQSKLSLLRQKLAPDGQQAAFIRDAFADDVFFFTA